MAASSASLWLCTPRTGRSTEDWFRNTDRCLVAGSALRLGGSVARRKSLEDRRLLQPYPYSEDVDRAPVRARFVAVSPLGCSDVPSMDGSKPATSGQKCPSRATVPNVAGRTANLW